MRLSGIGLTVALLLAPVATAGEVELSKIDRTIGKEPAYQSKAPKYCLLVFGPSASTRVWLVQDGTAFYLDRNADGDLAAYEKVAAEKDDESGSLSCKLGELKIKTGVAPKTRLSVHVMKDRTSISCEGEGTRWQHAGSDGLGNLRFGSSVKDAPIVHFQGPVSLFPDEPYTLERGEKGTEFYITLGTPGQGPGTFASMSYQGVPADKHPVAEFRFPSKSAGGTPVTVKVTLSARC